MSDAVAKLTIEPGAAVWSIDRKLTDEKLRFREQLGLPTDTPIVMTGHQAGFWHPGILAKYIAADAVARREGASVAWLVVDQDENDPLEIRCPVMRDGELDVDTARLGAGAGPTGWRDAVRGIQMPDLEYATPHVARGMGEICSTLRACEEESSLAMQVARATAELLGRLGLEGVIVPASSLVGTDAYQALVARMVEDPEPCIEAYNHAVAAHPDAGMRRLAQDELPLWLIRHGVRTSARVDDASGAVPRALMMTGIMRLLGCDLFIHGTGGGGDEGYEAAGEAWLRAWLDAPDLAPVAVASATMHLTLPGGPAPGEQAVAEAKARAHKARHDPAIVGDEATAKEKQEIVAQIAAAKKAGEDASAAFARMQSLLEAYRDAHASDFERLDEQAAGLERRAGETAIRSDRTWSFPLHDRLDELVGAIRQAFGVT